MQALNRLPHGAVRESKILVIPTISDFQTTLQSAPADIERGTGDSVFNTQSVLVWQRIANRFVTAVYVSVSLCAGYFQHCNSESLSLSLMLATHSLG
ncbi:MAG: hypothetical protein J07HQW1_03584 [Haloquadratum walsbyi J07HQW1]|uniref:Uncharacterized protein n=1 Tax=Haloquadratum walsbyi J07HQW1 TaxID=1238424 RepID=U1N9Q2_9EURY|nr:MAG: hypothetical protein J07HQW1_03584 [Haloquadratum walsbyi J07HQW1]